MSGEGDIFIVSKVWPSAPELRDAAPSSIGLIKATVNGGDVRDALIVIAKIFLGTAAPNQWPSSTAPQQLVNGAYAVGIAPVLYRSPVYHQLPSQFQEVIKRAYLRTAVHSVRLVEAMNQVCTALAQSGIEAAPFKGAVLSQRIYNASDMRQSLDIDLMIKRADVMQALKVLADCGYQHFVSESKAAKVAKRAFSFEMRNPRNGVLLDLQWDIANGYCKSAYTEEELFRQTAPVKIEHYIFSTFNETVTLYLISVHGAKNSWCELKALLDLAMMLKKGDSAPLAEVAFRMQRQGTLNMLLVGALLVRKLLGLDIPSVLEKKMNHSVQVLADEIVIYWKKRIELTERPSAFQRFKWDMRFREGMNERARYFIFRMRPTKRDFVNQKGVIHWSWGRRLLRVLRTGESVFR